MIFADGPQGGFISVDQFGKNTGLDAFKIQDETFVGPQGGIILDDKNGFPIPVGAFKMYDDQVGVMVLDKDGRWVPATLFNENANSFIRCGQGIVASGGTGHFINNHKLGPTGGIACVYYDTYSQPDQISIYYNGDLISYTYDTDPFTPAPVSGQGCLYFDYEPVGNNFNIQVHVDADETGTNWWYTVVCPTGLCKNKQPNTGSITYTIPMGGNCCADGSSEQNQTDGVDADCHYSFSCCGCHSRKKAGKIYREIVRVTGLTLPTPVHPLVYSYSLLSYTTKEYKDSLHYCLPPSQFGYMDCAAGIDSNPDLIYRDLASVAINDVLWDGCSDAAGCNIPYHNIFFRLCQTPLSDGTVPGSIIEGNPKATITLSCTIVEVEDCSGPPP